ncbi:hypothetical protein R80B4_00456 [Fibrobacteres bacterium R8-0-B4]
MQASDKENADGGQIDAAAAGIGKKMYYTISEACAMTGIEPHILRYWEKEFSLLRPKKNSGGKRAYKEKDIESIIKIKRMLEEEKYTLHGAKDKLLDERRERRTGGANAAAMKRRKTDAAGDADGTDSTDPAASTPSISIPIDTADRPTKRKSMSKKNTVRRENNGGINSDSGNDHNDDNNKRGGDALVLGIRDELLGVLELLERG